MKKICKIINGVYKTVDNKPNGATVEGITAMLENASPLSVKASGRVKI